MFVGSIVAEAEKRIYHLAVNYRLHFGCEANLQPNLVIITTRRRKNVIMTGDKESKSVYAGSLRVVYYPYGIAGLAVGKGVISC